MIDRSKIERLMQFLVEEDIQVFSEGDQIVITHNGKECQIKNCQGDISYMLPQQGYEYEIIKSNFYYGICVPDDKRATSLASEDRGVKELPAQRSSDKQGCTWNGPYLAGNSCSCS